MIERVICMTEILKDRFGKPLYQQTIFLKEKREFNAQKDDKENDQTFEAFHCGIFVKLCSRDIFDKNEYGF